MIPLHWLTDIYDSIPSEMRRWVWECQDLLRSPYPYLFALVAMAVENIRPVKWNFKAFLPALAQDFVWF